MTHQSRHLSFAIFQGQTMPTAKKTSAKTVPAKKTATARKAVSRTDAISILRADHKRVSELFAQFEGTRSDAKKQKIVAQICTELKSHAQVEEEIFYPAVKAALKDKELVPEATVEHASVKDLIAQVEGVPAGGEMYDARVRVMGEFVKHHVKEEQTEMFAKAKTTKLDMAKLGEQIVARKEELAALQTVA
jgi:hemerythrin superfamily protein